MNEKSNLGQLESNIEAIDGRYQIAVSDTGVFLTVYPPVGEGHPVREPAVVAELKKRDIREFNYSTVIKTVKEAAGVAVKVAEPPLPAAEPEIQILVERDRMEAQLVISLPKGCRPLLLEEVFDRIKACGVTYGIDNEAVHKALERPGLKVVCARGQRPVDGTDAYIKYNIDLENKGRPAELEDGRVDFKNLNMFTTVREGEVLAEKIPPTSGMPGIDVLGQPAYAKPGKDILLPLGKNVKGVDNRYVLAGMSGQLIIANNKINIVPVIEVKGDVDLSTGNIEFVGNVMIRGSVQTGFTVKAEGNVEVAGTVSGGIVEGKNIIVRMGIQGMHKGYVRAQEKLSTKFIENATVYAGEDVLVSDVVLHSKVHAGKRVVVGGKRGLIAGGHIMAGEEISCRTAGTYLAVATDLEVGVNPMLREEYNNLRKEIKKLEVNLDQAQKALAILKSMNQNTMPADKREMLLKLTKTQFHLTGQVETVRNRMTEIELAFEEMRYGKIKISDIVYPGAKIVVGTLVRPVRETMKYVAFYAEGGEVKFGPYK